MKKFKVTIRETFIAERDNVYEVEASNRQEAEERVLDGYFDDPDECGEVGELLLNPTDFEVRGIREV